MKKITYKINKFEEYNNGKIIKLFEIQIGEMCHYRNICSVFDIKENALLGNMRRLHGKLNRWYGITFEKKNDANEFIEWLKSGELLKNII